ncbi:MAG TPA: hypothetical protein VF835_05115 [Rhizomicrobium sp.]
MVVQPAPVVAVQPVTETPPAHVAPSPPQVVAAQPVTATPPAYVAPPPPPQVMAVQPVTAPPPPAPAIAMQIASPQTPAAVPLPPPAPDAHCEAVARQRADDAAANGLDRETQEVVRQGTYANCLAWDSQHPQSP